MSDTTDNCGPPPDPSAYGLEVDETRRVDGTRVLTGYEMDIPVLGAIDALKEFEEEHMKDGRYLIEDQIEYLQQANKMIEEAVASIDESAPEGITDFQEGSALEFTRGSSYALVGEAISNILYSRNKMKQSGIASAYAAMQNKMMAEEGADNAEESAASFSQLAQTMNQQQSSSLIFQAAGFAVGSFWGPGGAALGQQAGTFLGAAFGRA